MRRNLIAVAVWLAASACLSAQTRKLDTTQVVVIGEGLAAGVQDFGLRSEYQKLSFPAQVARQLGAIFPQPLIQGPGLAIIPGAPGPQAILPNTRQTLVREGFPPSLFVFHLAVPGIRLADAISVRPAEPMVRTGDARQTLVNLILGYPALILGKGKPLWTELEYAERMNPTLAIVCLGYHEAAEAAALGDPARMPDASAFRTNMNTVLTRLRANFAEVIVANVPDPFDTGYFTSNVATTRYVGASAADLQRSYDIRAGDFVTPKGLMAIGSQLNYATPGRLPAGVLIRAAAADQVRARVRAVNTEIAAAATAAGATLYDLNALIRQFRSGPVQVGSRRLTADYLGGLYSLSGFYPGTVGHALIANDMLALINRTFGRSFAAVDAAALLARDPAGRRAQPFRASNAEVQ